MKTNLNLQEAIQHHLQTGKTIHTNENTQLCITADDTLYWYGPEVTAPFDISTTDILHTEYHIKEPTPITPQQQIKQLTDAYHKQLNNIHQQITRIQQNCPHPHKTTTQHSNYTQTTCPDCQYTEITLNTTPPTPQDQLIHNLLNPLNHITIKIHP